MRTSNRGALRWNIKRRESALQSALDNAGFRSVNHACVVSGANPTTIGNMISGSESPFGVDGHLRKDASNFLDVLCETPDRIFPGCNNAYLNFYAIKESQARRTAAMRRKLHYAVDKFMDCLSQRERQVVIMCFYECMTFSEISSVFGVARERIRQILAKALRRMRRHAFRHRRCAAQLTGHTQKQA